MNKQDIIERLFLYLENLGIYAYRDDNLRVPAMVNVEEGIMIYNGLTLTLFVLAHESSHVLHKDIHRGGDNDACNPNEIRANKKAIEYLWNIFLENGGSYDYFNIFIDLTDCPFYMAYDIISKQYHEQEDALNEMDSLKDIDDVELQRCIEEYISTLDVVDEINIYGFLEVYHLTFNLYEKAVAIFHTLLNGTENIPA